VRDEVLHFLLSFSNNIHILRALHGLGVEVGVGELHGGGAALNLDGGLAAAAVGDALEAVDRAHGDGDELRVGGESRRLHAAAEVPFLGAQHRGFLEAAGQAAEAEAADVALLRIGDHAGAKKLVTRVEAAALGEAETLAIGRPAMM